jgi:hypothetical protein
MHFTHYRLPDINLVICDSRVSTKSYLAYKPKGLLYHFTPFHYQQLLVVVLEPLRSSHQLAVMMDKSNMAHMVASCRFSVTQHVVQQVPLTLC